MTTALAPPRITMTQELVDKATAEKYLGLNISNRNLRPAVVAAISADMEKNRWQDTHMPIAFDEDGKLIDGQHRLHSIVRTGKPQWLWVARDVSPSVQEVIDTSAARTGADALKLSKRIDANHPAVAAAARLAILWDEGHHINVRAGVNGARKVTNSEITGWVDQQNALPEGQMNIAGAVGLARQYHNVNDLFPLNIVGFAVLQLGSIDPDDMLEFFTRLDNLNFEENDDDPIKQLYQRMNLAKANKEQLRISEKLFFLFTAWNAFRAQETVKFVQPRGGKFAPNKRLTQPRVLANGTTQYARVPQPI